MSIKWCVKYANPKRTGSTLSWDLCSTPESYNVSVHLGCPARPPLAQHVDTVRGQSCSASKTDLSVQLEVISTKCSAANQKGAIHFFLFTCFFSATLIRRLTIKCKTSASSPLSANRLRPSACHSLIHHYKRWCGADKNRTRCFRVFLLCGCCPSLFS